MSKCFWYRDDQGSQVKWSGPKVWIARCGPATLAFTDGDLECIENCLLPDSSRGLVQYDAYLPNAPAKRDGQSGLGGHRRAGDIVIEPNDVRFIDWPDLEEDLLASQRIVSLANDLAFADRLYAALCNIEWRREGYAWSTTWREAARIVARLRSDEPERAYLSFYNHHWGHAPAKIAESTVADDVAGELAALDWTWREAPSLHPKGLEALQNSRRLTIALALSKFV